MSEPEERTFFDAIDEVSDVTMSRIRLDNGFNEMSNEEFRTYWKDRMAHRVVARVKFVESDYSEAEVRAAAVLLDRPDLITELNECTTPQS
jgi:hypothetical protein